jgi:hypothetical protein
MHSRGGPWAVSRIETSRKDFSGRIAAWNRGGVSWTGARRIGEEDGREKGRFGFNPRLVRGSALYRLRGRRGVDTRLGSHRTNDMWDYYAVGPQDERAGLVFGANPCAVYAVGASNGGTVSKSARDRAELTPESSRAGSG